MLADGVNNYVYDGESRISSLNSGTSAYTYDADGKRIRKATGSGTTEYFYSANNQVLSEYNPANGDWSDYIFAGSRRISRSDNFMNELMITGTNSTNTQASAFSLANAGGLAAYTIRAGDKLYVHQYEWPSTEGGLRIDFTDGTLTNWIAKDQFGDYMNQQTVSGIRDRIIDLSTFAGKQVSAMYLVSEVGTAAGNWALTFEQISLINSDGTLISIFNDNPTYGISFNWTNGATNLSGSVANWQNRYDPDPTITYYHGDHLGSARLMTGNSGWPIWQTTYLPFGQEWNAGFTVNHYKFTGYERDGETGNDYAMARHFSSQYGRFLSPDQLDGDISDPQTLNRYAYVRDNPVNLTDPSGQFLCGSIVVSCAEPAPPRLPL